MYIYYRYIIYIIYILKYIIYIYNVNICVIIKSNGYTNVHLEYGSTSWRSEPNWQQTAHMFPRKVPLLATSTHLEDGPTNGNWLENLVKKSLQWIIPYVGL